MRVYNIFLFLLFTKWTVAQSSLPILNWEERPEWVNVKTEISPAAVGDGTTDDTQALQTALNLLNQNAQVPKVLYLPAGTYRITQTLNIPKSVGAMLIGRGAETVILYDGATGGELFHTYGFSQGQMYGLVLDGNNKNGWLVSHNATTSQSIFEASPRYRYVQFKNAAIGVQGGQGGNSVFAASEMEFDNCLFLNCGKGIEYTYFNYYNEFIHHCEFWNCGYGINVPLGNVYVEQCHFRNSSIADMRFGIGHGHSVRRCSSFGSKRFMDYSTQAKSTIQDCIISNYTDVTTAISHYVYPCFLVFDLDIQNPPNNQPPFFTNGTGNSFILSNVNAPSASSLYPSVPAGNGTPLIIPNGTQPRQVTSATQSFFIPNPNIAGKVFDAVRDFGATTNDNTDDTQAIQNTINAAKNWGNGAIAYFPTGQYRVSSTILITGSNYFVGGSGFNTQFRWVGSTSGNPMVFQVENAQNVIIENLQIPSHLLPATSTAILHISSGQSHVIYDNVFTPLGTRTLTLNGQKGFHFKDLPSAASVFLKRTYGGLFFENVGAAAIYGNFVQTPPLVLSGSGSTSGYLGLLCANGSNGINIQTSGNQNLTIANMYSEQSGNWGNWGADYNFINVQGSGKITIGGQKMHIVEHRNMFNLNNFSGRLAIVNGIFNLQNPNAHYQFNAQNSTGQALFLGNHTGNNPMVVNTDNTLIFNSLNNYDRTLTLSQWAGIGATFVPSPVANNAGNTGYALQFDGINDYAVGTIDDNHHRFLDSFTVSFWVRPDAVNESGLLVGVQPTERDSAGNTLWLSWRVEMINGKVQLRLKNNIYNSGFVSGFSATTLQPNTWYYITATWNRQEAKIYVNGIQENVGTANFSNQMTFSFSSRFVIGGASGSFFKGAIDELHFYRNRVMDETNILANYNNGNGIYGDATAPNLYHGWHFDTPNKSFSPDFTTKEAFAILYEHNVNHNNANALAEAADVLDDFRRLGVYAVSFNQPINMTTVLPIEILDFQGVVKEEGNFLTWKIGDMHEAESIVLEKSENGTNFTPLSIVSKNQDFYLDKNPFPITYYRLKIRDLGGKMIYSKIISLQNLKAPFGGLGVIKIYPNPVSDILTIENVANTEGVEIVNILGQTVLHFPKLNDNKINVSGLENGVYFLKINGNVFSFLKK